ncbi:hypothetical protein Dimus_019861 [Dionaea muscipula]
MAVSNMCGLVPGEDRLFADGILLRLASAFASGDKGTRICIVKVFSSAFGHHGKKGRGHHGILLTMSLINRRELLNRVRVVLDDEDMESRALSLICFGCLAVIAKDAAEVEASLFAAGCISELSGDFAAVFLEMLINIVAAPNTLSVLRLAGTRTFAKMGHFPPLANKSQKFLHLIGTGPGVVLSTPAAGLPAISIIPSVYGVPSSAAGVTNVLDGILQAAPPALVAFIANLPAVKAQCRMQILYCPSVCKAIFLVDKMSSQVQQIMPQVELLIPARLPVQQRPMAQP